MLWGLRFSVSKDKTTDNKFNWYFCEYCHEQHNVIRIKLPVFFIGNRQRCAYVVTTTQDEQEASFWLSDICHNVTVMHQVNCLQSSAYSSFILGLNWLLSCLCPQSWINDKRETWDYRLVEHLKVIATSLTKIISIDFLSTFIPFVEEILFSIVFGCLQRSVPWKPRLCLKIETEERESLR